MTLDDLKKDLAFEIERSILEENNVHPLLSKMFAKLELDENNNDEFAIKYYE